MSLQASWHDWISVLFAFLVVCLALTRVCSLHCDCGAHFEECRVSGKMLKSEGSHRSGPDTHLSVLFLLEEKTAQHCIRLLSEN